MFLTDDERRALNRGLKNCPKEQRAAAREWAESIRLGWGMIENVIAGHMRIVGVGEDGEPLFEMTKKGGEYVERELLKLDRPKE